MRVTKQGIEFTGKVGTFLYYAVCFLTGVGLVTLVKFIIRIL